MANNEISDYTSIENGAIPTLEDEAVLGEPTSRTKSKTNAGKLMYLGLVLLGFLFVIIGLLVWQKNRSHAAPTAPKAELQKPEHERKNEVVDSASIARTKAELLEKEAADKAAQKSMEDEALKLAAAQEEEARQLLQGRAMLEFKMVKEANFTFPLMKRIDEILAGKIVDSTASDSAKAAKTAKAETQYHQNPA